MKNYIDEAKKKFNNKYTYLTTYTKVTDKIDIKCPIHGVQTQEVRVHLKSKYGCTKCGYVASAKAQALTEEQFTSKVSKRFGDTYTIAPGQYVNLTTPISIICPVHGKWSTAPNTFLQSVVGCPTCGRVNTDMASTSTATIFIEKARKLHGNTYDYNNVTYVTHDTPVELVCNMCKGTFQQTPQVHLQGSGCRHCNLLGQRASNYKNCTTTLYVLQLTNGTYKYGITRRSIHIRYKGDSIPIENVLLEVEYSQGLDAWDMEKQVMKYFSHSRYTGPRVFKRTGNSEIIIENPTEYIINKIKGDDNV